MSPFSISEAQEHKKIQEIEKMSKALWYEWHHWLEIQTHLQGVGQSCIGLGCYGNRGHG